MKIESLPIELQQVVSHNNGLRLYLNNLERGRSATPRSWLYEGKSDKEVLRMWLSELAEVRTVQDGEKIYQFDSSQLKKFGPQGEVKPVKELMDLVTEGYTQAGSPKPAVFSDSKWLKAKERAIERLIRSTGLYKRLRPRALKHVVKDMRSRDTLESNSGWPDFSRRKNPAILQRAMADAESGRWKQYPAILLFRNYNQKTRPVWMYPESTNLVEGSFTQPLKEAILKTNNKFFNPWRGYEFVLAQITEAYEQQKFLSASDFSHTDAYFDKWKILEVYDVIKYAFQEQYWDALKESMLHVVNIDLVCGSNKIIYGSHGVSSGSNWTNDVETYLDYIAELYLEECGLVDGPFSGIGDDVGHQRSKFMPQLAQLIAAEYKKMNFDVNVEKVTNDEDSVKYLQRLTIRDNYSGRIMVIDNVSIPLLRGIYSTIRALNSSLNPEKFHSPKLWSVDMFCCRQFMILENCVDHPLFEKFVKFICRGSAHLTKFAKKSSDYIDSAQRQSRLVPGLNPTYNQEKRDKPLSSFASIRIAASL